MKPRISQRGGPRKRFISSLVLGAACLLGSLSAQAQKTVNLSSNTLVLGSEVPVFSASDTRAAVQLLQFVDLETVDIGLTGATVELSGLLTAQLGQAMLVDGALEHDRVRGNVIVGLFRWHDKKQRVALAVGRQYLYFGAGRAEHLDGLSATYHGPFNMDLTVFGGRTRPWQLDYEPEIGTPHPSNDPYALSNWALGAKLRFRMLDRGTGSVSFVHEGHGGEVVRQKLNAHLGYWATKTIEGLAGGVFDIVDKQPQEIWATVISRPLRRLKLRLDYSYQVPGLAIAKTSLFSVFSTDNYQSISAGAHYGVTPRLLAGVEGGVRLYGGDDHGGSSSSHSHVKSVGYQFSGEARLRLGAMNNGAIGLRSEFVNAIDQWSLQNRLFSTYRFGSGIYANVDVYLLLLGADRDAGGSFYEQRINAHPVSFGAVGLCGYRLSKQWSAQLAGSFYVTPLARKDMRALARLTYQGSWSKR